MKVHDSALKHRALPEDAVQAEDWPRRELRLGFDTQARLLETVVLTFASGEALVIHAMPARKQYWDLLP